MDDTHRKETTKKQTQKKLEDGLQELSKLPAEVRMGIYEELFGKEGEAGPHERGLVPEMEAIRNYPFSVFRRQHAEVSPDGIVVRRRPRVFLSHSHTDKKVARKIYQYLTRRGILVWFDEAELRFGDSLIDKLTNAIDSVDILLALISRNSVQSEWVKKEIEIAMNQEIASRLVKVIPMLCDPVQLPTFLVGKLYADLRTGASRRKNLPKLVADINAHLEHRAEETVVKPAEVR
jgi:TIR domain-containing protein